MGKTKDKKKKKLTCPQCNKKVKAKWKFCRNCNYPLGGKSKKKVAKQLLAEKVAKKDSKVFKTPKLFKPSITRTLESVAAAPDNTIKNNISKVVTSAVDKSKVINRTVADAIGENVIVEKIMTVADDENKSFDETFETAIDESNTVEEVAEDEYNNDETVEHIMAEVVDEKPSGLSDDDAANIDLVVEEDDGDTSVVEEFDEDIDIMEKTIEADNEDVEEKIEIESSVVSEIEEDTEHIYGWRTATAGYEGIKAEDETFVLKEIVADAVENDEVIETVEELVEEATAIVEEIDDDIGQDVENDLIAVPEEEVEHVYGWRTATAGYEAIEISEEIIEETTPIVEEIDDDVEQDVENDEVIEIAEETAEEANPVAEKIVEEIVEDTAPVAKEIDNCVENESIDNSENEEDIGHIYGWKTATAGYEAVKVEDEAFAFEEAVADASENNETIEIVEEISNEDIPEKECTGASDDVAEDGDPIVEEASEIADEAVENDPVVPEIEEDIEHVYGWRTATAGYEAKAEDKMPIISEIIEVLDVRADEVSESNEEVVQEDISDIAPEEDGSARFYELAEIPETVSAPEPISENLDEVDNSVEDQKSDIEPVEPEFEPFEPEPLDPQAASIKDAPPMPDVEPMPETDPLPDSIAAPIVDEPVPVVGEDLDPNEKPQGEPMAVADPQIVSKTVAPVVPQMPIEDPPVPSQPAPPTSPDTPANTSTTEDPEEKKTSAGRIAGAIVGCVLCLLLGGVIGTAIQKNADSQRLQEAEEKLEALEEQLQEANPGHGIYNIEQLNEYLNEEFGIDAGDGTVLEELIENIGSDKPGQAQDTGRKGRGMMGVEIANSKDGVVVKTVEKDGAAAKAGIEEGDIIETINNKEVATSQEVVDITSKTDPGDTITVGIKGKGNIEITLG